MKLQGNVLNKNSVRLAAALLGALASFVVGPNAALAASPQHYDQAPGFYRLKVGDLEVKSCFWAISSMHSASSCSSPRSPRFSTLTRLRLRRPGINCCLSSRTRMF